MSFFSPYTDYQTFSNGQKTIIIFIMKWWQQYLLHESMISKLWYHQYRTDQIKKKFVASEKFLQLQPEPISIEIWMVYFGFTSYDDRLHIFLISFLKEV